ncbi:hypothetical protein J9T75_002914 [Salmonella enterica]|uniref:Uncharacterized protein n=1 Tax=Salmonella enterica I TaxID=59201 RepID=A0A612H4L7_SALET|nr:hypothetical protein [Salmonella enterica subsp. enterica]EHJ3657696.1 hypothetical protein [Salmonella enterica]
MSQKLKNGLTPAEMAHDIAMALIGDGWLVNFPQDMEERKKKTRHVVQQVMGLEDSLTSAIKEHISENPRWLS